MPAPIFIVLLAILSMAFPGSVFIPVVLWALIASPLGELILSICRALGLEGNW
jgi:hypothetical protein